MLTFIKKDTMKHLLLSLMLCTTAYCVYAQNGDFSTKSDEDKNDKPKPHFSGIDVGMGTLLLDHPSDYPYWNVTDLNLSSFGFNFMEYKLPIVKQYLGLTTGLGFNLNSIKMGQFDVVHTSTIPGGKNDTLFAVQNTVQNYRSNIFSYGTLSVPLMIEICSKKETKKSFYLDAGVVGYWCMYGTWQTRGKYMNGDRFYNRVTSQFQLAPFGAYATARLGFDRYGLFANYNLTPLFKKNATSIIYPLTFGISLNLDY